MDMTMNRAALCEQRLHSEWRRRWAQTIADRMDMEALGVKGVYLIGSVAAGEAGAGSDIDLIVHTDDDMTHRCALIGWFQSWEEALCAAYVAWTGEQPCYMLDVHYVTDGDIRRKTPFATLISSIYEPAELLRAPCVHARYA